MIGNNNIGEITMKLSSMIINNAGINEWFELFFKGKTAGRIHLRCVWEPNRLNNQNMGAAVSFVN
jgi:hypothetical protein